VFCCLPLRCSEGRQPQPPRCTTKNNPFANTSFTGHVYHTHHSNAAHLQERRDVEYEDEENGDEGVPSNIHKFDEEMPFHCDTSHDRRRNCEKLSRIHDVVLVCSTGRDSSFFLILFLFI
jgi:hypothetical protein